VLGYGSVTLTIQDHVTKEQIEWTLHDVLVVPELSKRLLSTDGLNRYRHTILFDINTIHFNLREDDNNVTVVIIPKYYDYDCKTGAVSWPSKLYKQFLKSAFILTAPCNVPPETHSANQAVFPASNIATGDEIIPQPRVSKRHVPQQLLHARLCHRSSESILLGHHDNIWNDISVQSDPETICQTCKITVLRRANRRKARPVDYPTVPGCMVMDIIPNPFQCGLNEATHFPYFLLIVNV
jgi:hypothetical protein